jgi:D-serine deaminase-like pyridoxal phosphate-dependent protein
MLVHDLPTPALVIEADVLEANLAEMAKGRPGASLRPHVKAHKCTSLARRQSQHGHQHFTCATPREAIGMAAAGLGHDLLVANEVLDTRRLTALAELPDDVLVTVAIDSDATLEAAALAGVRHCVIDVDVGLPRCGCAPDDAGRLAAAARRVGLEVRGVMGYEGHLMMVGDRDRRREQVEAAMASLLAAHGEVGGDVISAGGTGTYDLHERTGVSEVQAGSYALMDSAYGTLGLPFRQALFVVGTIIASKPDFAVADVGLKALGMDHGNPSIDGADVWFCSDEHITFSPSRSGGAPAPARPGARVRVVPAHIDPTMAMHEAAWLVRGDEVLERWEIDLRGWG